MNNLSQGINGRISEKPNFLAAGMNAHENNPWDSASQCKQILNLPNLNHITFNEEIGK